MRYLTPNNDICNQFNKKETPITSKEAQKRWKSFSKHKPKLLQTLLNNQYHLCCYSELRADEEGFSYHIEHLENKSQNPTRTFDCTNLAASALNSDPDLKRFKEAGNELFGGHALGKSAKCAIDMTQFISCYQSDCQRFFSYISDGRAIPAGDLLPEEKDKAKYTIDLLNLNSGYLINLRKQWWEELDYSSQEYITQDEDFKKIARIHLLPNNQTLRLSRFFSLTYQFFGSISKQITPRSTSA